MLNIPFICLFKELVHPKCVIYSPSCRSKPVWHSSAGNMYGKEISVCFMNDRNSYGVMVSKWEFILGELLFILCQDVMYFIHALFEVKMHVWC